MMNFDPVNYRVQVYCELEMRGMEDSDYIPQIAADLGVEPDVLVKCLRAPYWDWQVCASAMREWDEPYKLTDEEREIAFRCMDCAVDTQDIHEYYTLHNHVWYDITSHTCGRGMLCLGCVEHRLGRTLVPEDFQAGVPINEGYWPRSERFVDRIGR
jgi:hypothetical protein